VDPPEHNKAMVEKLTLPFPLLSDPKGDLAKRCDLWNGKEGVAIPAIVIVDRRGVVRYLYAGHDFADRPGDEEVFGALDRLSEAGTARSSAGGSVELRATAEEAETSTVHPDRAPMPLEQLTPYYGGVFFATIALKRRFGEMRDRDAFREVDRYQRMVKEYRAKIQETVEQSS
jgi:hypothetical protein